MEVQRGILLGRLAPVRIPHSFRADRRTRIVMDLRQKKESKNVSSSANTT